MIVRALGLLLLVVFAGAQGLRAAALLPQDGSHSSSSRSLLQKPLQCTAIHKACRSCRAQRVPGTRRTENVCSVCETGWRLRRDGISKTCDCNPGMSLNGSLSNSTSWCQLCAAGYYCPGGDKTNPNSLPRSCATGLATVSLGARSEAQCFTLPGYGRVSTRGANGMVSLAAALCSVGSYNVGRNTAGCQRCNPGLTTVAEGAGSILECVAPPGSYYDRGMGRKCQQGTYSTDHTSRDQSCTPCGPGVTTPTEGSNSSAACSLAKRGHFMAGAGVAQPCALNTYSNTDSTASSCTPCPYGMRTLDEGADGVALCMAPPGYELWPSAEAITECAVGWYKEGWNRNPCVPCGAGLVTATPGAVGRDACLVPAGWGLVSFFPMMAKMCTNSSYGDMVDRPAVSSSRCVKCSPNMYTLDELDNVLATSGYMAEEDCKLAPGWGTTNTEIVEVCPKGSFNPGGNRAPCQQCPQGFTTLGTGKTSSSDCVVQPGWAVEGDLPKPCDKGYYSVGGTAENPNGACEQCGRGFTTQEDEATSSSDCNVCQAGFGFASCQPCPYNTYSSGGALEGDPCTPCATGTVSHRMSYSSEQCYGAMQLPAGDILPLSDDSFWQTVSTATTDAACSYECSTSSSCIMYRFGGQDQAACQVVLEDAAASPAQQLGFKLPLAADYVLYTVPAALTAGRAVQDAGETTLQQCMEACTGSGGCEVFSFPLGVEAGPCRLWGSELDADYTSMWHVEGSHLFADRSV